MIGSRKEEKVAANINYSQLLKKHGLSHKSLHWGSRDSQFKRFQILAEIGDLGRGSVLDVGCGLCDLYSYLCETGANVDYHGIDLEADMIAASRERFASLDLSVGDVLDLDGDAQYDYVVSSGIFTYFPDENAIFRAVGAMFEHARKGVAFNALSPWANNLHDGEINPDPLRLISKCTDLTTKLVLRHDYMPHDFTIYLYKE